MNNNSTTSTTLILTTKKIKLLQHWKTEIVTKTKKAIKLWQNYKNKLLQNSLTQIVTKLKLKFWQNSKTQIVTKLKKSNCDKTWLIQNFKVSFSKNNLIPQQPMIFTQGSVLQFYNVWLCAWTRHNNYLGICFSQLTRSLQFAGYQLRGFKKIWCD